MFRGNQSGRSNKRTVSEEEEEEEEELGEIERKVTKHKQVSLLCG